MSNFSAIRCGRLSASAESICASDSGVDSIGGPMPNGQVLSSAVQSLVVMSTPLPADPVSVLVADDHPVTRAGIRAALKRLPQVRSITEATNGVQAVATVRACRPDAVFMDDGMPRMNGWRATQLILQEFPLAKVIMISMRTDAANLQRACNCGALGYLLKSDPVIEFQRALVDVLRGRVYVSASVSQRLARAAAARRQAFLQKLRNI